MKKNQLNMHKRALITGILCFAVGVIMFIIALGQFGIGECKITNINDVDSVFSIDEDANAKDIYQFDNMIILDEYATYSEFYGIKTDDAYYTVMFFDKDGTAYYASLEVSTGSEIYKHLEDYINDDEQYIGDMIIPVCAATDARFESELLDYYDEAIDSYKALLEGEDMDEEIYDSRLKLRYACDIPANIGDYNKSETKTALFVFGFISLFTILFLFVTIKSAKKIKKIKNSTEDELLAEAAANTPQPEQYAADTQTGEYYNPSESQYYNPTNNEYTENKE